MRRHTFRVRIQCMQWIQLWWRMILVCKQFDWRLHLYNNDLDHIFVLDRSNCRSREGYDCMQWNHSQHYHNQGGIHDIQYYRVNLGTILANIDDTLRFRHSLLYRLDKLLRLLDQIDSILLELGNIW